MILVFRRPSFFLSDLQCNQAYVRLSNSLSINQNVREPVVKIFQYRTSESTPFRPLSSKTSKKKLNKYILITPRTILSISLLAIRSLIVALIGLVIATSERISKLNYRCSLVQEFQVIQLYVIQQMNIVHAMTQTICLLDASNNAFMDLALHCRNFTCTCSLCRTCFWDGVRCRDCPTSWEIVISNGTRQPRIYCYVKVDFHVNWDESVSICSTAATSFFGPTSHLVYIDNLQELTDVSVFATNQYYDIFIGHTNSYNYPQWFLSNGTLSPPLHWCAGLSATYATLACTRLLIGAACVTNIVCHGWTSRYICKLN
ncbi:unnamed protein product [Rotaria socialis]|uniref:Uncharacterized protein n=3 Tax=Rotaria socialis TaxID=392032 RepID=A0A820IBX7_9BILA|nr:unnamed protein product [Rotaria socialis]